MTMPAMKHADTRMLMFADRNNNINICYHETTMD